jgi:T-complex protein 1 subunit alpha
LAKLIKITTLKITLLLFFEFLQQGNELIKSGVHPTLVINGFNLAKKEACKFIANMSLKVDALGKDCIMNTARTSISSKIIGA